MVASPAVFTSSARPPRHATHAGRRRQQSQRQRQRGSVLVLAVVLIVLLVMMGASYLQMARSDRRSTLQMDTRSQDYQDSILRYIGLVLASDVEFGPEFADTDGNPGTPPQFHAWGQERHDYPFTWSDRSAVMDITAVRMQFPVPPSARKGLQPRQNGGAGNTLLAPGGANSIDDPTVADTGAGHADDYYYADGVGVGVVGREAFSFEYEDQFGGTPWLPSGLFTDRGQNDDMWLASTRPEFGRTGIDGTLANGAYWPHISNLTGVFIDIGVLDANNQPRVYMSTADNNLFSGDSWLPLETMQSELLNAPGSGNPIRFADADGDGIADSRWTFAPVGGDASLTYVMAVRIVDNSALANLNVASEFGTTLPPTSVDVRSRFYTPADLALDGAFVNGVSGLGSGNGGSALDRLMAAFNTGAQQGVRDMSGTLPTFAERTGNWVLASQSYGNPTSVFPGDGNWEDAGSSIERLNRLGSTGYTSATDLGESDAIESNYTSRSPRTLDGSDEAELRWRHGLNRSQDGIPSAATFLESATELTYWRNGQDEVGFTDAGFPDSAAGRENYFNQNPRLRFTVASGSGDFDRLNLNREDTAGDPFSDYVEDFILALADPLNEGGLLRTATPTPTGTDLSENFDFLTAARGANLGTGSLPNPTGWNQFAEAAAAFLSDWRDDDLENGGSQVIPTLSKAGTIYGMEYLPFIGEVYLKAEYDVPANNTAGNPNPSGPALGTTAATSATQVETVQWDYSKYYAVIELVNPFNHPIPVADVQLELRNATTHVVVDTFGTPGALRTAIVNALPGSREFLLPNEIVVLHIGSLTNALELGEVNGRYPIATPRVDITALRPANWPVIAGGLWDLSNNLCLVLSVEHGTTGNFIPYQRFSVPEIPNRIIEEYPQGNAIGFISTGDLGVARIGVGGTAAGLQMLAVAPDDLSLQDVFEVGTLDPAGNLNAPITDPSITSNLTASVALIEDETSVAATAGGPITLGDYNKGRTSRIYTDALDTRINDVLTVTGNATAGTTTAQPASGFSEPFIIGNAGMFYRATDLFRVVFLGPRDNTASPRQFDTVAEVWREKLNSGGGTTFDLRDFMIDFASINGPDYLTTQTLGGPPNDINDPSHLRTTFPALLLERVSTFAPGADRLDNDGDGQVDDTDERLVPGRVNLNTVHIQAGNFNDMFERLLPINTADSETLSNAVRQFRENPTHAAPNGFRTAERSRAVHGLGISDLAHLLDADVTGTFLDAPANGAAMVGDFNEYEPHLDPSDGLGITVDDHRNDAEERLAALGAFKQAFDVRSDLYTAYILVRGYPANDFSAPIEEYTITATFDRSVVHNSRPLPRLVAVTIRRQDP
ncbi:MAG: hypothetical protein AAF328_03830 [Planctomycetota bacterium]